MATDAGRTHRSVPDHGLRPQVAVAIAADDVFAVTLERRTTGRKPARAVSAERRAAQPHHYVRARRGNPVRTVVGGDRMKQDQAGRRSAGVDAESLAIVGRNARADGHADHTRTVRPAHQQAGTAVVVDLDTIE